MRIFSKSVQDPETINLAERRFDVSVSRLKRARRLTLRIDTNASRVKISAPASVDAELVHGFLERNRPWILQHLVELSDCRRLLQRCPLYFCHCLLEKTLLLHSEQPI